MKFKNIFHQILVVVFIVGCSFASSSTKNYFTGAVFEHARQADDSPDTRIQINLEYYMRAAQEAKKQGADLIVFPEYGLFPPGQREEVKKSLEFIPNPNEVRVTPCNEAGGFSNRPILYTLSCTAKINGIVIVANMGGIDSCHGQPPECPADEEFQYNANVAFDQNGTIVGRYYKEHLFFEDGMDYPVQKQDPTFETNFGKFAMFISFDILFKKVAEILGWWTWMQFCFQQCGSIPLRSFLRHTGSKLGQWVLMLPCWLLIFSCLENPPSVAVCLEVDKA